MTKQIKNQLTGRFSNFQQLEVRLCAAVVVRIKEKNEISCGNRLWRSGSRSKTFTSFFFFSTYLTILPLTIVFMKFSDKVNNLTMFVKIS